MSDLIERLRGKWPAGGTRNVDVPKAADLIEAQAAEIARLRETKSSQTIISALAQGLHAQMFGVWSMHDPQFSHAAISDSGQLHEAVHALIEALPAHAALEIKP